ncbi:site-specific DNA-methyltransferase [Candidatus Poribacteria bacterium]|nr:site-specific DNA-methyltransferase [Candidatus Poribacteria bacterium]
MPTLEFNGKHHIYTHHLTVPYRPLETDESRSCNPTGEDDNLIIHGDNLHALKALLPRYINRIKCIYIDPPYNTGKEDWEYNDNVKSPLMQAWFKENSPIDNEDLERHEKWLCMMWPRLHLLKELLAEDGVIFISIDDNEQHHLRMLMDDIFGGQNFVTNIIWQKKFSPQNDAKYFSDNHDFVVCYAKNKETWRPVLLPRTEKHNKRYSNPDNDPRGPWSSSGLDVKTYQEDYDYPITTPSGRVVNPPGGACWRYSKERFEILVNDNRIWFGEDGNNVPRVKRFLSEVKQGITPLTVWLHEDVGHTQSATQGLNKIGVAFSNPKPHTLIKRILQIGTDPDSIILDSFAGSGTTAQAVLALNKEDGGNRKFILIECEDYADTITAERVRRVINGVPDAKDEALREGLGGSFTYCTLGEPIEIEAMLTGEKLPTYTALATNLLFTTAGLSVEEVTLEQKNDDGLFFSDDKNDYYLIYKPDLEYLRSNEAILNLAHAKRIQHSSHENGNQKAIVYAAGNYIGQRELTKMGIAFCQLPYVIHER